MNKTLILGAGSLGLLLLLVLAYKLGKLVLRLSVGLAVLALLSWWLWKSIHS